jgi:energy-coupling factor transporter ATP-binding protein EcfA2
MDHNTIKGIEKLRKAIDTVCKYNSYEVYTEIIGGVEISCADKMHVGVILPDKSDKTIDKDSIIDKVEEWLANNLVSVKDGSFRTSYDVMNYLNGLKAIIYIAHINTSQIFSDSKFLSGAYQKKLFHSPFMKLVGINKMDCRNQVKRYLCESGIKKEINFLLDNDAHTIDEISKNIFWIKGNKISFSMLREALRDYEVSVKFENYENQGQYIEGIYIDKKHENSNDNNSDGFLIGKNGEEPFCVRFSESLNCFIGARGAGKSTILALLEYALSQRCNNIKKLDFLCKHGNIWIVYKDGTTEYLIKMAMAQKNKADDNILSCFGQNESQRYNYRYNFNEKEIMKYARDHYLHIYKVIPSTVDDQDVSFQLCNNKILSEFFDTMYSVNELVNTASGEEIDLFIKSIMFKDDILQFPNMTYRIKNKHEIQCFFEEIPKIIKEHIELVHKFIDPFNESMNEKLRISYSRVSDIQEPQIGIWLFGDSFSSSGNRSKYCKFRGKKYDITENALIDYFLKIYDEMEFLSFFHDIIFDKIDTHKYSLLSYAESYTKYIVDQEIERVDSSNQQMIVEYFVKRIASSKNISSIHKCLDAYIRNEKLDLEFNVNGGEAGKNKGKFYKSISELSLGQKVVAMLDFVLGYSEYSKDYRPLILDQPEDNLDSQYIFENLVKQLRQVKSKRQVIIATHSATIVTNAMADQVCVMDSDGKHGRIIALGYPSEKQIKRHIVNYMEGGVDSFQHKISIYQDIL